MSGWRQTDRAGHEPQDSHVRLSGTRGTCGARALTARLHHLSSGSERPWRSENAGKRGKTHRRFCKRRSLRHDDRDRRGKVHSVGQRGGRGAAELHQSAVHGALSGRAAIISGLLIVGTAIVRRGLNQHRASRRGAGGTNPPAAMANAKGRVNRIRRIRRS